MAVADRFAERDYVGRDGLRLKSVKPGPDTSVAGLYFIGYADASAVANGGVDLRQIAFGKEYLTTDARAGFGDESRQTGAALAQPFDNLDHAPRVFHAGLRIVAPVRAAIDVRDRRRMNPCGRASSARPVVFVRADVDHRVGVAVIGGFERNQVAAPRVSARQPQSQLIRLAAGVDEEAYAQTVGQCGAQRRSVLIDQIVKVTRVGVERGHLAPGGLHDARVAMAHVRHIVVSVQITTSLFIEQILHPAAHDLDRLFVSDAQVLAERAAPDRQRFGLVRLPRWKTVFGYAENQVRVGREATPNVALAREADAGKIAIGIERISNDLEVQVRRPSAVFTGRAEAGDLFAFRYGAAHAQPFERLRAQVAIEREEGLAACRPVFQDNHVAIIERRGVVCERVQLAFNRREDRRARFCKKIDAQVNRASLAAQFAAGREERRGIKHPRLVVSPDADPDARLGHCAEDAFGQSRL